MLLKVNDLGIKEPFSLLIVIALVTFKPLSLLKVIALTASKSGNV